MSIINAGKAVQSNWSETNTSDPSYIQNKPTIPAAPVQSNWNESNSSSLAYIQNKPTIPSGSSLVPSTSGVTNGYVLTNNSGTPTWAASSGGLGTSTVGGSTLPIYLNAGVPTAITTGTVSENNTGLVTGGQVYAAIHDSSVPNGTLVIGKLGTVTPTTQIGSGGHLQIFTSTGNVSSDSVNIHNSIIIGKKLGSISLNYDYSSYGYNLDMNKNLADGLVWGGSGNGVLTIKGKLTIIRPTTYWSMTNGTLNDELDTLIVGISNSGISATLVVGTSYYTSVCIGSTSDVTFLPYSVTIS